MTIFYVYDSEGELATTTKSILYALWLSEQLNGTYDSEPRRPEDRRS